MRVKDRQGVAMRDANDIQPKIPPRLCTDLSRTTGPSGYLNWLFESSVFARARGRFVAMLDIREIQAIQREVCFFRSRTRIFTNLILLSQLNSVTKIVNGIAQRFQQRLDHAASTIPTLDALQDRIVELEKEISKLKSDNDQLKALKEKTVVDAEALKKKHHVQRQKIEQITEERDGALQRLEKLEVTFRGCFSGDRPGVSLSVQLGSKAI